MAKKARKGALDDLLTGKSKKAAKAKGKKSKASTKKAPESEGTIGRAVGEERGVKGVNMLQILREVYSKSKGATIAQGAEAILEGIGKVKANSGLKYSERLAIGRVRKFLKLAASNDECESLGETREGETKYRYSGEVNVSRGRKANEEPEEKPAKVTKKKASKKAKAKGKKKTKAA